MALNIGRLFRKPNAWTPQHLEGLNVREHQRQPASAVVGTAHLPSDKEPRMSKDHASKLLCSANLVSAVFASLVEDFAGPTKDDVIDYFDLDENNPFSMGLSFLGSAVDSLKHDHSPFSEALHLTRDLQACTDYRQKLCA